MLFDPLAEDVDHRVVLVEPAPLGDEHRMRRCDTPCGKVVNAVSELPIAVVLDDRDDPAPGKRQTGSDADALLLARDGEGSPPHLLGRLVDDRLERAGGNLDDPLGVDLFERGQHGRAALGWIADVATPWRKWRDGSSNVADRRPLYGAMSEVARFAARVRGTGRGRTRRILAVHAGAADIDGLRARGLRRPRGRPRPTWPRPTSTS